MRSILLVALCACVAHAQTKVPMTKVNDWVGKFQGSFVVPITDLVDGWELNITFCEPVTDFSQWMGDMISSSSDNKQYTIVNKPYDGVLQSGTQFEIPVTAAYSGSKPPCASAIFSNLGKDPYTVPPHTNDDHTKYDYDDVLMKSILFYEAQRSGKLPANNRIPWRGDSALGDKGNDGEDLTGGWYDAGDHVKFGLPMAYSATVLTWGLLQFKDAYMNTSQLEHMYDSIRWPLEYLLKAHVQPEELYVQVGDGGIDHAYWGRPEDMTMERPAFKISATCPGSDVAGETAAAMAAGYLAFKDKDADFATQLLNHSKQLYDFALKYRGIYTDCIQAAAAYYRSSGYEDELAWGGAWLYLATNDSSYLTEAEKHHQNGSAWGLSWDDKQAAETVLLYQLTKKAKYQNDIEATFKDWMPGGTIPYTPGGLAWRLQWGSNRYACNMALVALMAAENGLHQDEYRKWAMSQIHFVLGNTNRSFVVGFGKDPPNQPHHRASSCPMMPAPCAYFNLQVKAPNPHTLYGALVGGPNQQGQYTDSREDYVSNEVACDYNAAFQGAVAGFKSLFLRNELPPSN